MRKTIFPIIVVGTILRLWNLGRWSFWIDEVLTTLDAQKFPHIFRINPIPYAVVKFFISLFGTNEWSARLGPVIFGVAAIPVIYLIASHIFSARVGLLASLFVAFLPWHLFWSQNARSYSFTFLFSLISAGMFFLAFERNKLSLLLCSLFFYLLLVLSHMLSGALILSFIAYAVCLRFLPVEKPLGFRRSNLVVFFAPFILALFILLLFALVYPELFHFLVSGWGHNIFARSPIYVLFTLIYGLTIPLAALAVAFGFIYLLSAFRPLVLTTLEFVLFPNRAILFLLCYALAPLTFFLITSIVQNVAGYYLFFTVPAYIMLVAVFCESLTQRTLSYILIFILLAEMAGWNYLYFNHENGGRPMWREAFTFVRNEMKDGDLLICSFPRLAEYYLPEASAIKIDKVLGDEMQDSRLEIRDLRLEKGKARIWFVLDERTMNKIDPRYKMRRWIQERSRLLKRFPVYTRTSDRSVSIFFAETLQSLSVP